MNTPIFKKAWHAPCIIMIAFMIMAVACKDTSYIYNVEPTLVQPVDLTGKKEKTPEQYIAILYANLYQRAMSPNQLVKATETIASIGDKQVAYETIISKFMNDPAIKLPSDDFMRDSTEAFIQETYKRFFVRVPTEAEKTWMINYIKSHPEVTPEHVYYAFAISNEYYYY